MQTLITGGIGTVLVLGFFWLLVQKVPALPLIVVFLIGLAMIVVQFVIEVRDELAGKG